MHAVKNSYIANNDNEIENLVEKRDRLVMKFEGAEAKLMKTGSKSSYPSNTWNLVLCAQVTECGPAPLEEARQDS